MISFDLCDFLHFYISCICFHFLDSLHFFDFKDFIDLLDFFRFIGFLRFRKLVCISYDDELLFYFFLGHLFEFLKLSQEPIYEF